MIPPQDVREAADGAFWLIQGGAIAAFRALPLSRAPTPDVGGAADLDPDSEPLPEPESTHEVEMRERAGS